MSTNEMMTLDAAARVVPIEEAIEGWKWAGSTLKEIFYQDHEIVNKQNETYMSLMNNPETPDDRYYDASVHASEVLTYKKESRRDVLSVATIVILALCGVRSVNIIR